jgi:hypothetical protein
MFHRPTWDEAAYVTALVLAGTAFAQPVTATVCFFLAFVLAVVLWTPLRGWLGIPGGNRRSELSAQIDALLGRGMELLDDLSQPLRADESGRVDLGIDKETADRMWDLYDDAFALLVRERPAYLPVLADAINAAVTKRVPAGPVTMQILSKTRSVEDEVRAFHEANLAHPKAVVEGTLDGLAEVSRVLDPRAAPATSVAPVPPPADKRRVALHRAVRNELVAAIDDGNALRGNFFRSPHFGPLRIWQDKSRGFIETVFGSLERQRFDEDYDPTPETFAGSLDHRLRRLADLRDRPESWELRVGFDGLQRAGKTRRHRSQAERIVEAFDDPADEAAVPKPLLQIRGDLAQFLNRLSSYLRGWTEFRFGPTQAVSADPETGEPRTRSLELSPELAAYEREHRQQWFKEFRADALDLCDRLREHRYTTPDDKQRVEDASHWDDIAWAHDLLADCLHRMEGHSGVSPSRFVRYRDVSWPDDPGSEGA